VDDELWLIRLRQGEAGATARAHRIVESIMDRLASILHSDVGLFPPEIIASDGSSGNRAEDTFSPIRGRFNASAERDSSAGIFHKPLYFGGATFEILEFTANEFEADDVLLTAQIRIADFVGEFTTEENELNFAVTIALAILASLFFIVEIFSLFFGLRIATGITSAVKVLHQGTKELAKGNLDVRIDVPNEDEFGDLADSFNEMTHAVRRGQEELLARERLERELRTAREIQQRLLPYASPSLPGFQIAGISEPSRQVGGDYYDFLELPEDILGVAVGDVSGKGIPAALLMSNLQASLKGQVIHPSSVAEVVSKVNDLLVHSTDTNMFATFFYGVLNRSLGTFTATNAGHDPPIICRADGRIERMSTGGLILGVVEGQPYQEETVILEPGDVMVLYTDGITEAIGPELALPAPKGEPSDPEDLEEEEPEDEVNLFEEERLLDVIRRSHTLPAEQIKEAILDAVNVHTSGIPQSDDITLVVIKREDDGA
jgi:sigma-B regulation protein RsbU (phosphoserine phosphatase)